MSLYATDFWCTYQQLVCSLYHKEALFSFVIFLEIQGGIDIEAAPATLRRLVAHTVQLYVCWIENSFFFPRRKKRMQGADIIYPVYVHKVSLGKACRRSRYTSCKLIARSQLNVVSFFVVFRNLTTAGWLSTFPPACSFSSKISC